jgi:OmpA-OmpF porin, OOP family
VIDTKKIIGLFLILFQLSCFASAADSLTVAGYRPAQIKRLAKAAYKQKDFGTAIYYYEQFLKKGTDPSIVFNLAESYRYYRDYQKAEEWYTKAFEQNNNTNALALYYVALMQKMNGKYAEAKQNFENFRKRSSSQSDLKEYLKQLKVEVAGCDTAKKLEAKPAKIVVLHMDTTINKTHIEASPLALNDSLLLFASLRTNKKEYMRSDDTVNYAVRKFYVAEKSNDEWSYKGEFEAPFNEVGVNTGNGSISPDGKRFYFTRCKKDVQGKMICAIYVSHQENGKWDSPVPVAELNDPEYTSTQPTVANESQKKLEVIYFASDRPKGKGGMDIWYAIYDTKKKIFRAPKNAGGKINTVKDEITPFYDVDRRILFFSSDGWAGLGGLDIFQTRGELNKFSNPVNVGYPINSSTDDVYYAEGKNKEEGFFVSNRKGGVALKNPTCCDDLYSFKKLNYVRIKLNGLISEKTDSVNKIASRNATVHIFIKDPSEPNPIYIKSVTTNDQGIYNLDLEQGLDYKIQVKKDGYFATETDFSTKSYITSQTVGTDLDLNPTPKEPIVLKNIYYNFGKADLKPSAITAIDTTILKVMKENENIKVEISSHTDSKGADQLNMNLSQKRAESVVNYLISKGIAKERLEAKGYGKTQPIAPNKKPDGSDDPEGMEKNRRTEFKIIGTIPLTEIEYEE